MCNSLFLHHNRIIFLWRKDFNIPLLLYRYKIKPTLFFNYVVITIWLLHNLLRCFLFSINCEMRIDFSALYISFKLPNCLLNFVNVSVKPLKRKILETYYIKACQPSLNSQINSVLLNFFRNGVTQNCLFYASCICFNCF